VEHHFIQGTQGRGKKPFPTFLNDYWKAKAIKVLMVNTPKPIIKGKDIYGTSFIHTRSFRSRENVPSFYISPLVENES